MESTILRQNPYAIEEMIEGKRMLISFHYGTHIDLAPPRDKVWKKAAQTGIAWPPTDESIVALHQLGFLIPEDELQFRSRGLDRPAPYPAGEPRRVLCHLPSIGEYIIVGIPSDRGNKISGTRHGPGIIRRAFSGLNAALRESIELKRPLIDFAFGRVYDTAHLKLTDYGDIVDDAFASAADLFARIEFVIQRIVSSGAVPVILGGDHSITASAVFGITDITAPPILLQFDAHHDCYTDTFAQRNGLTHGNFVQHLLDRGAVAKVVQIGLRTVESVPLTFPHLRGSVQFLSSDEFSEAADGDILNALPIESSYYVSIDLDVLPPESGGSTATPVFGGIAPRRLIRFLDVLFRARKIIGIDVVEAREDHAQNADLMVNAASRILLMLALSQLPFKKISVMNQAKI